MGFGLDLLGCCIKSFLSKNKNMEITKSTEAGAETAIKYNRESERKAFYESKTAVKGLVEAGVSKVPRIFIQEQDKLHDTIFSGEGNFSIPIINLVDINNCPSIRKEIIEEVKDACEKWGFFQIVNHGISSNTLDEIIDGVRRFHEQNPEVRKKFYNRENFKEISYRSNNYLYQAGWMDSFLCLMAPTPPSPQDLPEICRDVLFKYTDEVRRLELTLLELLSEALGLHPNHLRDMGCAEGLSFLGNYYPACPEPDITMGLSEHTDSTFLTLLLQDQMGGLQILHKNQWVNVTPIHGALVINIGDMMQLISNDKFKSVRHRVLARNGVPRISVAASVYGSTTYGPIKDLVSEEKPPIYREITSYELVKYKQSKELGGYSGLEHFKL